MNPAAGSFTINPRLQRHFAAFAVSFPSADAVKSIYGKILTQYLTHGLFSESVQKTADSLVECSTILHSRVTTTFLPTANKFHYVFNLRDLSNIFQGLLFARPDIIKVRFYDCSRSRMHYSIVAHVCQMNFFYVFIVPGPILRHLGEFGKIRLLLRENTRFLPEGI